MKSKAMNASLSSVEDVVKATVMTVNAFKATTVGHEHMGYFISALTAKRALEGTGHRPNDGEVEPVMLEVVTYIDPKTAQQVVRILSLEVVRFSYEKPSDIRDRALSKLTSEELEVLGLKR